MHLLRFDELNMLDLNNFIVRELLEMILGLRRDIEIGQLEDFSGTRAMHPDGCFCKCEAMVGSFH
jgi:hypothetical protein